MVTTSSTLEQPSASRRRIRRRTLAVDGYQAREAGVWPGADAHAGYSAQVLRPEVLRPGTQAPGAEMHYCAHSTGR